MHIPTNRFYRLVIVAMCGTVPCLQSLLWAQNPPQALTGRVTMKTGEGRQEALSEVTIRLITADGAKLGESKTNGGGFFSLQPTAPLPAPSYLLYFKPGYKAYIKRLEQIKKEPHNAELKKAFYTPESVNIVGGVFRENQGIPNATIYAHDGVFPVQTNQQGEFLISIALETDQDDSHLWVEADKYQTKIISLPDLHSRNPEEALNVEMTPSTTAFRYGFTIRRKGTNESLKDVDIRINNNYLGRTKEDGSFSTQFEPVVNGIAENVVEFSHPQFRPFKKKYSVSQLVVDNDQIFLEPPTFNIEPLVYYQAEDSAMHFVTGAKFSLAAKPIRPDTTPDGLRLRFPALFGERLKAELAFAPGGNVQQQEFTLRDTSAVFNWKVSKPFVTAQVELDSLPQQYKDGESLVVYLVQGVQLFKARQQQNSHIFKVTSNRLDPPQSRSDWRVLVISSPYGINPKLARDQRWLPSGGNVYTGRVNLRETLSRLPSSEEKAPAIPTSSRAEKLGAIKVETTPVGAKFRVEELSELPVKFAPDSLNLPTGRYTLSIEKGGYRSQSHKVEVKAGSIDSLRVNLGDELYKIKVVAEIGGMGWFLAGGAFPTVRAGGHLLYHFSPHWGVKFSYFASKVPGYYIEQVFAGGFFAGAGRLHGAMELRENTFEATRKIKAKFDGRSLLTNLWFCVGRENPAIERLPFIERYRWAIHFGYETPASSINRTFPKPLPREQEFSLGGMMRLGRGFLDGRYGRIKDEVSVKKGAGERLDTRINRALVSYFYFLN